MLLLVAAFFLLSGNKCYYHFYKSDPIEINQIYGKYYANFGEKDEYIEIREDTTYVHYYFSENGHQHIDSGYWQFQGINLIIAPDTAKSYIGKGSWKFTTECSKYRIAFYDFTRRTLEQYGFKPHEHMKKIIDTTKFTWQTCFYRLQNKMIIKIDNEYYYVREIDDPAD
jgi:hypothetical protein